MNDATPRTGHASMPAFATWIQDNLLLPLLIVASGYVNGLMLVEGIVPNIEDPNTWGTFHGIGVVVLFAAGLAMGGLTLRVSYKLSECVMHKQWGRAIFLGMGMLVLAVIEFWASFSQRAPNLPPTAADLLLPFHSQAFSATAILIALVIPFASQLWGFAATDPEPKPAEDSAMLAQRLDNERIMAEHQAQMKFIKAHGNRAAVGALFARPAVPSVTEPVDAPTALPAADGDAFVELVNTTRKTIQARGGDAGATAIIAELEADGYATAGQVDVARAIAVIDRPQQVANDAAPKRKMDRVHVGPPLATAIQRGRAAHIQTSADVLATEAE